MTLGETIKDYRTQLNLSQTELGDRIGVSRQAVSKWGNGSSDPSTTNLIALASLFDITPVEMLKEIR